MMRFEFFKGIRMADIIQVSSGKISIVVLPKQILVFVLGVLFYLVGIESRSCLRIRITS